MRERGEVSFRDASFEGKRGRRGTDMAWRVARILRSSRITDSWWAFMSGDEGGLGDEVRGGGEGAGVGGRSGGQNVGRGCFSA